jgi:hypothetical protein
MVGVTAAVNVGGPLYIDWTLRVTSLIVFPLANLAKLTPTSFQDFNMVIVNMRSDSAMKVRAWVHLPAQAACAGDSHATCIVRRPSSPLHLRCQCGHPSPLVPHPAHVC